MQQHQTVHHAGVDGPGRLFAQDRDIVASGGPGHHPLRPRHQADHAAGLLQIGAQKRHGKAVSGDRLALDVGPKRHDLLADRALRHAAQLGAIVEIPQIENIKMHCAGAKLGQKSR